MAAPSTPPPARVVEVPAQPKQRWRKFVTPLAVVLLALAIVFTITRNWNSWEGGRIEQVTGGTAATEGFLRLVEVPAKIAEAELRAFGGRTEHNRRNIEGSLRRLAALVEE